MKKTLHFWLMALLIGGLSMAVTSCKDDDKTTTAATATPNWKWLPPIPKKPRPPITG